MRVLQAAAGFSHAATKPTPTPKAKPAAKATAAPAPVSAPAPAIDPAIDPAKLPPLARTQPDTAKNSYYDYCRLLGLPDFAAAGLKPIDLYYAFQYTGSTVETASQGDCEFIVQDAQGTMRSLSVGLLLPIEINKYKGKTAQAKLQELILLKFRGVSKQEKVAGIGDAAMRLILASGGKTLVALKGDHGVELYAPGLENKVAETLFSAALAKADQPLPKVTETNLGIVDAALAQSLKVAVPKEFENLGGTVAFGPTIGLSYQRNSAMATTYSAYTADSLTAFFGKRSLDEHAKLITGLMFVSAGPNNPGTFAISDKIESVPGLGESAGFSASGDSTLLVVKRNGVLFKLGGYKVSREQMIAQMKGTLDTLAAWEKVNK